MLRPVRLASAVLYAPHYPIQNTCVTSEHAQVSQGRLAQIGQSHHMAADLFVKTLEEGKAAIQKSVRVRHLTPDERKDLAQLRRNFLEVVLKILAEHVATSVNQWFNGDVIAEDNTAAHQAIEQVADAYLQQVSSILSEQEHNDDAKRPQRIGIGPA